MKIGTRSKTEYIFKKGGKYITTRKIDSIALKTVRLQSKLIIYMKQNKKY